MTFERGKVVTLKSGGPPMTVVAVAEDDIDCIWVGEEGDLFRETIPAVALAAIDMDKDGEDEDAAEDGQDEDEDDDEPEEEEGAGKPKSKGKRKVA